MSSLPTEHFRVLSVLLIILAVTYGKEWNRSAQVLIHLDNNEVVTRGTKTPQRRRISKFLIKDYDLQEFTYELVKMSPLKSIKLKWVKGHQATENANEGDQDLIKLNERCDELASKGHTIPTVPTRPFFTAGKIALYCRGHHVQNLRKCLTNATGVKQMDEYLLEKTEWTRTKLDMVDWLTIGKYLKSLTDTRRCTVIKLMHGWQNIGEQKYKFHISKKVNQQKEGDTNDNNKDEEQEIAACPSHCGERETNLHYIQCQHPLMKQAQVDERGVIKKKLERLDTPIEVITFILMGLSQWSNKQEVPYEEIPTVTGTTWGTQLLHALQEQDRLGWDKMHRGFMSRYW